MSAGNSGFKDFSLAGGSSRGGGYTPYNIYRPTGFPFFLPTLFGSGELGDLVGVAQSDIGYLGSFGIKNYRNLTIPAGVTWTLATGSSSGAFILGVSGTFTLGGTISLNGASGSPGTIAQGGAGGAMAGGGVGGVATTVNGAGTVAVAAGTTWGHGLQPYRTAFQFAQGADSGAFENNNAASGGAALGANWPKQNTATAAATDFVSAAAQGVNNFNKKVFLGGDLLAQTSLGGGTNGTTAVTLPTTNDYGPWSQDAKGLILPRGFIPGGISGAGGPVTGVVGQQAGGGGGGGGGGVGIVECQTLNLLSGYSFTSTGGNSGNGFSSNGTTAVAQAGVPGAGGVIIIICRNLIGSTAAITANAGSPGTGAGTAVVAPPTMPAGGVYILRV